MLCKKNTWKIKKMHLIKKRNRFKNYFKKELKSNKILYPLIFQTMKFLISTQNFNMLQWHQLIQFYHYPLVSKMINLKKKLILELELTEMSKENLSFFQLSKKHNLQLSMILKLIWNMHQLKVMLVLTKLPEVFYLDGIIKMWIVVG